MAPTQLVIDEDFGLAVLSSAAIAFQCFFIGLYYPNIARNRYFTKAFMEQFQPEHRMKFGFDISKYGYPDMGNGRYAAQLPYEEWVKFNNAQRIHHNCLEQLAPMVTFTLLGGLWNGTAAGTVGFVYFVARTLSSIFYMHSNGSSHPIRGFGSTLGELALLVQFTFSILGGLKIYGAF